MVAVTNTPAGGKKAAADKGKKDTEKKGDKK